MEDNINPDHYRRLPAEAIEIIESAIDNAPSAQDAYLHGQVLKYILRCWNKNGIEDLKKAKWYLDRLIKLFETHVRQKEADLQSLKDHPFGKLKEPAIKQSLNTEPPDGWRFLDVGEVIRKGDRYFKDHEWIAYDLWVGGKIAESDRPSIRRNRFEVGEKVIDCRMGVVFTVQHFNKEYSVVFVDGVSKGIESKHLAPYIEETK